MDPFAQAVYCSEDCARVRWPTHKLECRPRTTTPAAAPPASPEEEVCHFQCLHPQDVCGPIKLVDIAGKGRGVIVTSDVLPGALLLVSHAFAAVYDADNRSADCECSVLSDVSCVSVW